MKHFVVRHADAGDRHRWKGPDDERPLSRKGRRQAEGVASLLGGEPVGKLWSSPFVRCLQTVEPLAHRLHLPFDAAPELAEGTGATGVLKLAMNADDNTVMCTHGDVVDALLDHLRGDGVDLGKKPRCSKGSTWVLDVSGGRVVAAAYLPAPG
ncbi:MAG: histidine phosphatase family protein [Actinobacteria bacterium]|nr:histidine phosphatase family protein [Actinomycetota bacterium]